MCSGPPRQVGNVLGAPRSHHHGRFELSRRPAGLADDPAQVRFGSIGRLRGDGPHHGHPQCQEVPDNNAVGAGRHLGPYRPTNIHGPPKRSSLLKCDLCVHRRQRSPQTAAQAEDTAAKAALTGPYRSTDEVPYITARSAGLPPGATVGL